MQKKSLIYLPSQSASAMSPLTVERPRSDCGPAAGGRDERSVRTIGLLTAGAER